MEATHETTLADHMAQGAHEARGEVELVLATLHYREQQALAVKAYLLAAMTQAETQEGRDRAARRLFVQNERAKAGHFPQRFLLSETAEYLDRQHHNLKHRAERWAEETGRPNAKAEDLISADYKGWVYLEWRQGLHAIDQ